MENRIIKDKFFWIICLIATILILLIVLVVYVNANSSKAVSFTLVPVKQQRITQKVLTTGRVQPAEKTVIYSLNNGFVKKLHVKLGQRVKPGDLLMEIDVPEAQQKLLQARLALDQARRDYAAHKVGDHCIDVITAENTLKRAQIEYEQCCSRLEREEILFDMGVVSKETIEQIRSEKAKCELSLRKAEADLYALRASEALLLQTLASTVNSAQASLELCEKQIEQTFLRAPVEGSILSINVEPGDQTSPNTVLLTIGDTEDLIIKADVSEADALKLTVGQEVNISASSAPSLKCKGYITQIGLESQRRIRYQIETSVVPIVVSVRSGTQLRPGFGVDLEINTITDKAVLVVPVQAVTDNRGNTAAFVAKDGKAILRPIETGMSNDRFIEVISGLRLGEKVILNPPSTLKTGTLISNKRD